MLEGYRMGRDADIEIVAWQTMHLINIHSKKRVTVDKLLGRGTHKRQSESDKRANFKKLMEGLNKQ